MYSGLTFGFVLVGLFRGHYRGAENTTRFNHVQDQCFTCTVSRFTPNSQTSQLHNTVLGNLQLVNKIKMTPKGDRSYSTAGKGICLASSQLRLDPRHPRGSPE